MTQTEQGWKDVALSLMHIHTHIHTYMYTPTPQIEEGWKDVALGLMQQYTDRTNESYIDEDKTASVTWHWDRCNPDFGNLQVQQDFS
jgi:hypothetical protein